AGKHVLLDPEGGNIKAVNHILRRHNQFDVASHWNVQFVDLTLAFGVFELPHPLFRHNINFGRIGGRSALFEIHDRAPGKNDDEDEERNRAPGKFESGGTFDLLVPDAGTVAEARREISKAEEDQQRHHPADDEQENVESIHAACHGGSL